MPNHIELFSPVEYIKKEKQSALRYMSLEKLTAIMDELHSEFEKCLEREATNMNHDEWCKVKDDQEKINQYLSSLTTGAWNELQEQFKSKAEEDFDYRLAYCAIAGIKDTEEEKYYYWLTHQAKYSNEAEYREVLRQHICTKLRAGKALTKPENDWLVFVLEKVEVPHNSKGSPRRNRDTLNRQYALASFILKDKTEHPNCTVKKRIERAASALCITYETARDAYYSEGYGKYRDILGKLQQS